MLCNHLKELYKLCEEQQLKLASSDLIRIVCRQCDQEETCPAMLMDEYDARTGEQPADPDPGSSAEPRPSSEDNGG